MLLTATNIKVKRQIIKGYAVFFINFLVAILLGILADSQGNKAFQAEKKFEQEKRNAEHAKQEAAKEKQLAHEERKNVENLKVVLKEVRIKAEKIRREAEEAKRQAKKARREAKEAKRQATNAKQTAVQATKFAKYQQKKAQEAKQKTIALEQRAKNSQQELADTNQQVKNSQQQLADNKQEAALIEQKTIASQLKYKKLKKILAQAKQERQQLNGEIVSQKCWGNWKNKYSQKYVRFPTPNLPHEDKKTNQVKSPLLLSKKYLKLIRNEPHTFELSSSYGNFGSGGNIPETSFNETPFGDCNL